MSGIDQWQEILNLRAQLERYRAALEEITNPEKMYRSGDDCRNIAREALK